MSDDVTLVPIAWVKGAGALFAALVFGAFMLGRCSAGGETPLPPKVQRAIDRHMVQTIVDSSAVVELQGQNARLMAQRDSQVAISKATDSAAMNQRRRADTLQAVAVAALTAADSAAAWHTAHDARKLEADSAEASSARKSAIIKADTAIFATKDSLFAIEHHGRMQADSLVAQLLPLAKHRDQCKIAWVINCPTRKQAVVGGVALGAVGALILTGKIKVPISLRF